ncbi:MAG TPA: phosphopantetheine-binding protein [Chitinophaga sp.]|nr:phosphopantetheine-binding protein [Chitinophaga sp.]HVI45427.1 phosphopantetheine-binding protein [Chitinophaga sp.]
MHVAQASSREYVAPRNATEQLLADLWQQLLEVRQAGIYDDFFELGGHSLKAIRMMAAIRKQLGVDIPVSKLFEHKNIAQLAAYIITVAGNDEATSGKEYEVFEL